MGRIRSKRRLKLHGEKIPYRSMRKANRRRGVSSLESKVYRWLEEDKVPFRREFPLGMCHVDIFLPPDTLVELNGCHWHGCRKCNQKLSPMQEKAQVKDGRRYSFFRSKGFKVVVIWECDVEHHPKKVRRRLKELSKWQG